MKFLSNFLRKWIKHESKYQRALRLTKEFNLAFDNIYGKKENKK